MGKQTVYEERLTSGRTEALFVALALLPLAGFVLRFSSAGMDGWSILLLVVTAMFAFYALNYRVLIVRISREVLNLRFGVFEWAIPVRDMEFCSADTVSLWRIGGAGIHFTFIGGRYRAMFNFLEHPRLVVGLREKKGPVRDVVFSTRRPAEVMMRLAPRRDGELEEPSR